jgi:hypothetical protein
MKKSRNLVLIGRLETCVKLDVRKWPTMTNWGLLPFSQITGNMRVFEGAFLLARQRPVRSAGCAYYRSRQLPNRFDQSADPDNRIVDPHVGDHTKIA